MKLKPIPLKLLPNSVTYYAYSTDTGEGSSWGSATTLYNVKIDEQKQFISNQNGREIIGKAMLFYDCTNSSGLTGLPLNESKIVFNGRTYYVVDTDILRSEDTPHHYEILLK